MKNSRDNHSRNRGVALVLVLWMLTLLTLMAAGYSATMRTETRLTAHHVQTARARALSEAGIWFGIRELLRPQTAEAFPPLDGTPLTLELERNTIEVRLYDESGKIDLNTARPELLQGLFESAGLTRQDSLSLLDALLDWRDRDNLKRNNGAEDEEYLSAGREYGAKDGPFNSVAELRLVLGMSETVFRRIAPALTVHSHQPLINPRTAPRAALLAVPGLDADVVEEYLRERGRDHSTMLLQGAGSRYFTGNRNGRTVTVAANGQAGDSRIRIEAVILLKPGTSPPYSVLSWREFVSADQQRTNNDIADESPQTIP